MQPIKVSITGHFWDSYAYQGILYVINIDGSVSMYDQSSLIHSLGVPSTLRIVSTCAFFRGDYLYGKKWSLIFSDDDVRNILTSKFDSLARMHLEIDPVDLDNAFVIRQDLPFPFPYSDILIYSKTLYCAAQEGLFSASTDRNRKFPVQRKAQRLWDAPLLSMSASYQALALAAGEDGLWELKLNFLDDSDTINRLSSDNTMKTSWLSYSILSTALGDGGTLAEFSIDDNTSPQMSYRYRSDNIGEDRSFIGTKSVEDIFHMNGLVIGSHDKIYMITNSEISSVRYQPWKGNHSDRFVPMLSIPTRIDSSSVINASVAHFGVVLEMDDSLVILLSDGQIFPIPGEPVNWRVLPRSKYYTNQLHVVYEDRLDIWSFNQDYFVNQDTKILGAKFSEPLSRNHSLS